MITTELQFKAKQDFDGTLDGFAAAVAELVRQAQEAGAPPTVTYAILHEGRNYGDDKPPRYASFTCKWEVAVSPTGSEEVNGNG